MSKRFQEIAKVIKSHKLDGAVKIKLTNCTFNGETVPSFLYINTENNPLPYFVKNFTITTGNECIVEFEDWNSREEANNQLKGKTIFIDMDESTHQGFQQLEDDHLPKYTGYQLFNQHQQLIGKIEDVYDIPNNTLLAINIQDREVLIPIHADLMINVKDNQKEIYLHIPEGLINLDSTSSEEE